MMRMNKRVKGVSRLSFSLYGCLISILIEPKIVFMGLRILMNFISCKENYNNLHKV